MSSATKKRLSGRQLSSHQSVMLPEKDAGTVDVGNRQAWDCSIAALRFRRLDTVDQAAEAVINEVLNQLNIVNDREAIEFFLSDLFATDLGLQEELERSLVIEES